MRLLQIILFFAIMSLNHMGWSLDRNRCANFMKDGLYKKYEYLSALEAWKKYGSTTGFTYWSTEPTTTALDPKVWLHSSTSVANVVSSFGPCRLFGIQEMFLQREKYFVQNKVEILKEIARARGEHLNVLAAFSLCEADAVPAFRRKLQNQLPKFIEPNSQNETGKIIDRALQQDSTLKQKCIILST